MSKVFILLMLIMIVSIIFYPQETSPDIFFPYEWSESCYGIECLDRPDPYDRSDWGVNQNGHREFCYNKINGGCFL